MSGIEVAGLITGVISVIVIIENLYSNFKDEKNLPQAFHDIADRLPLVRDTLRIAKQNIEPNTDEEACRAMGKTVENCRFKVDRLEEIFNIIAPSEPQSRIERYRTAVRRWGKGNKVEDLAKGMMEDVKTLAMNRVVQAATEAQVAELLEAIRELSSIQPSLLDEESVIQHHTGSGDNVAGNKYQGNHNEFSGHGTAYFAQVIQHASTVTIQSSESRPVVKAESNIDTCLRILPKVKANSTVIKDCEPASWILENETYRNWFHYKHEGDVAAALLTLKGKVGAGKSVLMKQLATDIPVTSDTLTIRIHHSFQSESVMDASLKPTPKDSTMLHLSLLATLVNKFPADESQAIANLAVRLRQMTDPAAWNECNLAQSINDIVKENKIGPDGPIRFRIFIDGFEDCSAGHSHPPAGNSGSLDDEASKVLDFVSELLRESIDAGVDMGVCLSRGYFKDDGAHEPSGRVIELEKPISNAVYRYIVRRLEKLPKTAMPGSKATMFSFSLTRRSTNGFLWASIVTEHILRAKSSTTVEEYRRLAESVPDQFSDFYTESLKRISLGGSMEALNYLQLILAAARSLSSEEFRHASAFFNDFHYNEIEEWEKSDTGFQPGFTFKDRIRQTTMGLIEVAEINKTCVSGFNDPASNLVQPRQTIQEMVRFIHPSVIEFLYGGKGLQHFYPELSGSLDARCHLFLFQICMRVLKSCTLLGTDKVFFLEYACAFWPHHARGAGALLDEAHIPDLMCKCNSKRQTKLDRIIEKQIMYLKCSQAKEFILLENSRGTTEGGSNVAASGRRARILVLLATLGCTTLLLQHLKQCRVCGGPKLKANSSLNETKPSISDQELKYAIQNAIKCGHSDTAKLLLELRSGADPSILSTDSRRCTVLYQACYHQQLDIVKSLLLSGADPTEHTPFAYEYPLNVAIVLGNIDLIKVLLHEDRCDRKEMLELRCKKTGHTALHFAVTTRQKTERKLAALEAVIKCAPHGLGLLELVDARGKTPLELAEGVPGKIGSDLVDVLVRFEEDDEVGVD